MSNPTPIQPAEPNGSASEPADDLDRIIAEAESACDAKCSQVSASEAGRKAELTAAREEVERERGFRSDAESKLQLAIDTLKRITAKLRES